MIFYFYDFLFVKSFEDFLFDYFDHENNLLEYCQRVSQFFSPAGFAGRVHSPLHPADKLTDKARASIFGCKK
jgi:hypothetical protein